MGIPIPIYVGEVSHSRRHAPRAITCPHCKEQVTAAIEVGWIVRKLWGIPVRSGKIESSFDCPSCARPATLMGDVVGGSIPFMHQLGFIPLIGGVIAIPILILWAILPAGPKLSYVDLLPLETRARVLREQARAKISDCPTQIESAVKKAFPKGPIAAPAAPVALELDLAKAPTVRFKDGKLEHDLCDTSLPYDPTLTGYADLAENQLRLRKFELEVERMKVAPAGFVVTESTCTRRSCTYAKGLVSRDGQMLGNEKKTQKR